MRDLQYPFGFRARGEGPDSQPIPVRLLDIRLGYVRLRLECRRRGLDGILGELLRRGFEVDGVALRRLGFRYENTAFALMAGADQAHPQSQPGRRRRHHEIQIPVPGQFQGHLARHERFDPCSGHELAAAADKRQFGRKGIDQRAAIRPEPQRDRGSAAVVDGRIADVANRAGKLHRNVDMIVAFVGIDDLYQRTVGMADAIAAAAWPGNKASASTVAGSIASSSRAASPSGCAGARSEGACCSRPRNLAVPVIFADR